MAAAPVPPLIADAHHAAAQLAALRTASVECAVVLYLDPEWRLLGRSDVTGTTTTVTPSFRTIFTEALRLDATTLVLAHSHPNGDARPSVQDITFTRALIRTATTLGIAVADHLIVAGDHVTSLREAGLM